MKAFKPLLPCLTGILQLAHALFIIENVTDVTNRSDQSIFNSSLSPAANSPWPVPRKNLYFDGVHIYNHLDTQLVFGVLNEASIELVEDISNYGADAIPPHSQYFKDFHNYQVGLIDRRATGYKNPPLTYDDCLNAIVAIEIYSRNVLHRNFFSMDFGLWTEARAGLYKIADVYLHDLGSATGSEALPASVDTSATS